MTDIKDIMTGGNILPITRWGTPVMHELTTAVTVFDEDLRQLARDMFATMEAANGVGLAATQVGRGISMFVYDCPDDEGNRHVGIVCNPTVTLPEGRNRHLVSVDEGCLSLPGGYEALARPDFATCNGHDIDGNEITVSGTGFFARCLQHETDHLNGMVFGDRLSARSRKNLYKSHEATADRYPADWPATPKQ